MIPDKIKVEGDLDLNKLAESFKVMYELGQNEPNNKPQKIVFKEFAHASIKEALNWR